MIIALFGPDGSGKTSIAHAFAKDYRIISIRGTHLFASAIARFLNKFEVFRGNDNPYYEISLPEKLRWSWCIIEFVSILPYILFKFAFLPNFVKIVAERSIPDFIAWIVVTTRNPNFMKSLFGKFLLGLSKKQNRLIYVTASIEVLSRRRPESVELIRNQVPVYDVLAKILPSLVLDTTHKTVEESSKQIRKVISS